MLTYITNGGTPGTSRPRCDRHNPPWMGAQSFDRKLAAFNAMVHEVDMHPVVPPTPEPALFELEPA